MTNYVQPQSLSLARTLRTSTVAPSDPVLRFDGEVKLGDLLTTLSIIGAALTVIVGAMKDRRLKRREYADRVRAAAMRAIVATSRRREIGMSMFEAIQPAITAADVAIAQTQSPEAGRDELWKAIVSEQYAIRNRLLDERIEDAFAALYGYDARIKTHFEKAIATLTEADNSAHRALLDVTQLTILDVAATKTKYQSADFGNPLRIACESLRESFANRSARAVMEFETVIAAVINASDRAIWKHDLPLEG